MLTARREYGSSIRHLIAAFVTHLRVWHGDERGLGGEALVVMSLLSTATLLTSAMVTSGSFTSEQIDNLVHDSVGRISGSLEIHGTVVATARGSTLDSIQIPLTLWGNGATPVRLDPTAADGLVIAYRDEAMSNSSVPYSVRPVVGNGDDLLEPGEMVVITVRAADLGIDGARPALGASSRFTLELDAPVGGTVEVSRTLPFVLQPVMALR